MYDGTMDSVLFEQWFEECLIPDTDENAVFVIDPHFIASLSYKLYVKNIIAGLYSYHHIHLNLILLKKLGLT